MSRPVPLILVFVKAPLRGRIKTRLAAFLGEDAALGLYRSFAVDLLSTIDATNFPLQVLYTPADAQDTVAGWLGAHRRYAPQTGADLGNRMEDAFRTAFAGGATRAVLVGSDLPDLPGGVFAEAFRALDEHDAVIGPAADGGYYLIGFRDDTFLSDVFHGISWSSDTVFSDTLAVFARTGKTVFQLPQWQDVDTIADLRDLADRGSRSAFRSSRTMSYLAGMGQAHFSSEGSDAKVRL